MLPRRELLQSTSNIPATENPPGSEMEELSGKLCFLEIQDHTQCSYALSVPDEGDATSYLLNSSIHGSLGQFFLATKIFMWTITD
jgi:hypothetical protein